MDFNYISVLFFGRGLVGQKKLSMDSFCPGHVVECQCVGFVFNELDVGIFLCLCTKMEQKGRFAAQSEPKITCGIIKFICNIPS